MAWTRRASATGERRACHVGEPPRPWRLKTASWASVLVPPREWGPTGSWTTGPVAPSPSVCSNFAVVGVSSGGVHQFNMQSGAHRGAFSGTI